MSQGDPLGFVLPRQPVEISARAWNDVCSTAADRKRRGDMPRRRPTPEIARDRLEILVRNSQDSFAWRPYQPVRLIYAAGAQGYAVDPTADAVAELEWKNQRVHNAYSTGAWSPGDPLNNFGVEYAVTQEPCEQSRICRAVLRGCTPAYLDVPHGTRTCNPSGYNTGPNLETSFTAGGTASVLWVSEGTGTRLGEICLGDATTLDAWMYLASAAALSSVFGAPVVGQFGDDPNGVASSTIVNPRRSGMVFQTGYYMVTRLTNGNFLLVDQGEWIVGGTYTGSALDLGGSFGNLTIPVTSGGGTLVSGAATLAAYVGAGYVAFWQGCEP